jgi:hypothetical protein
LVKLKKYFHGIGMIKRTLIMTVVALFVSINFNTVLTHAQVLSFSDGDSDLDGSKTSITRNIGGRTVTFSGGISAMGLECESYGSANSGLYANYGNGVKLTISSENGYIFDIDSFKAKADDETVKIQLTHGDETTESFSVSVSMDPSTGFSEINSSTNKKIQNVKKVVLSSSRNGIFQDFDIVNVRKIPYKPTVYPQNTSNITATTATLNAKVYDTGGDDTTVYFNYGTTSRYGTKTSDLTVPAGAPVDTIVSINISGLSPNTNYSYEIVACNAGGTATTPYSFKTLAEAPGAPTIGTVTAGDKQAEVSFTAPASNGGAEITGYTVTSSPGGFTGTGTSSPITVKGLTNGTAYIFTVTATNLAGTGVASGASNSVTPKASQTITFENPGAQGFGTTPTLTATASSGLPVTFTSDTPSVATVTTDGKLTFLTAGTATIKADQAGDGTYLGASTVTQSFSVNAAVPGAPTIGTATAGDKQAEVSFTAPVSNGGDAIKAIQLHQAQEV